MNCTWEEFEQPDARGWRRVRCRRCGRETAKTPHAHDRIYFECRGWPWWHEWGHWAAIFFAAAGITKGRYEWLRAKLGLVGGCRCGEREQELNSRGERFMRWLVRWRFNR